MYIRFCLILLMGGLLIAGCNNDKKAPVNQDTAIKKSAVMAPFKYHKLIEVSPGQYYDILSWGRGSIDTNSFLILHSDSSGRKYSTTTGDLNGVITDVYNTDLDVDGNPEILIQVKKKDTVNFTTVFAFEFSDNKAQKLDFPKLTSSQRKGYRGGDNFYIEEGKFIREFPIYTGAGSNAKPTGQKRKLEYGLSHNAFTVKQLSKDSTNTSSGIQVQQEIVKKEEPAKKENKSKKSEKQHKKEKPARHHKKRHHHSSEE
jgi:hypothetical protein